MGPGPTPQRGSPAMTGRGTDPDAPPRLPPRRRAKLGLAPSQRGGAGSGGTRGTGRRHSRSADGTGFHRWSRTARRNTHRRHRAGREGRAPGAAGKWHRGPEPRAAPVRNRSCSGEGSAGSRPFPPLHWPRRLRLPVPPWPCASGGTRSNSAPQHPSPSKVATPVPQRHGPSTTRSVPKHGPSTMAPPGPCGAGGWRGEPAAPLRLVAPRTAGCGASARPGSGSGTSRRACRARAMPPHGGDFLVSGSVKRCWSLLAWQTGCCRKATNGSVSNL